MKITADTNVLVRAPTEDHTEQTAQLALGEAEIVALASFDKKAVTLMETQGLPARLLA